MRMSEQAYETILEETRVVIARLEETGAALHPGREFDADNLTIRDLWDIKLVADMDRSSKAHPRHTYPGLLPRCLEFTDRSPHYLYDRDGENLDDVHIETALKKVMATIKEERAVAAAKPSAVAAGPRL
jgi:hypothetical protein